MKNIAFIVFTILVSAQTSLASVHQPFIDADSTVNSFFQREENVDKLNFPRSTFRFYQRNKFQFVWFAAANTVALTDAVRLLSCVSQFGLSPKNYHRNELDEMLFLSSGESKAQMEVLFSDALITLIEQLHFGVANPEAQPFVTDADDYSGFRAEEVLEEALSGNFREVILEVQPRAIGYITLQKYLNQAVGQFKGECKELTTDTLQLLALNLERYKWENSGFNKFSVEINVPAYMLRFRNADIVTEFKVVVGKATNPTPHLASKITYLNTAPDWNVPPRIFAKELLPKILDDPSFVSRNNFVIYDSQGNSVATTRENLRRISNNPSNYSLRQNSCCDNALGQIVFRFPNSYNVYLHDTPEKSYFLRKVRALSHGCIRVETPKKLLSLLLAASGAGKDVYDKLVNFMALNQKYTYTFPKPIPIYIRYITCEVKDGKLIIYKDVYNRDKALATILFD